MKPEDLKVGDLIQVGQSNMMILLYLGKWRDTDVGIFWWHEKNAAGGLDDRFIETARIVSSINDNEEG